MDGDPDYIEPVDFDRRLKSGSAPLIEPKRPRVRRPAQEPGVDHSVVVPMSVVGVRVFDSKRGEIGVVVDKPRATSIS